MPLFSVIIPTYNRAALLGEALESVFAQEFRDYEVIVVDDGSTDGTPEVLQYYGDRIRLFHQENKGPGAARNTGIRQAQGDYVAFLDSDDVWFPWTLKLYCHALARRPRPGFIAGRWAYLTQWQEVLSDNHLLPTIKMLEFAHFFEAAREFYPFRGTPALAVKAETLRRIGGFAEEVINGEDQDLCLRLGLERGFIRIDDPPLYAQRIHQASATACIKRSIAGAELMLRREKRAAYPGGIEYQCVRREAICALIRSVCVRSLVAARSGAGLHLYFDSLPYQLRERRFRFILGIPFLAVATLVRRYIS